MGGALDEYGAVNREYDDDKCDVPDGGDRQCGDDLLALLPANHSNGLGDGDDDGGDDSLPGRKEPRYANDRHVRNYYDGMRYDLSKINHRSHDKRYPNTNVAFGWLHSKGYLKQLAQFPDELSYYSLQPDHLDRWFPTSFCLYHMPQVQAGMIYKLKYTSSNKDISILIFQVMGCPRIYNVPDSKLPSITT